MARSLADSTDEFDDYRCPFCGAASSSIEHIQVPAELAPRASGPAAVEGKPGRVWRNRCMSCHRTTEYVPTRADIERESAAIRAGYRASLGCQEDLDDD